jgi:hypothetical protein
MFKNLMQVYSLAVCLIMSIILMLILSLSVNAITDFTLTEYKNKSSLSKFSTNEDYISSLSLSKFSANDDYSSPLSLDKAAIESIKQLSSEKIEEKRLAEKDKYIQSIKDNSISSLISYAGWLLIGGIFFIIHWRLYKKSEN